MQLYLVTLMKEIKVANNLIEVGKTYDRLPEEAPKKGAPTTLEANGHWVKWMEGARRGEWVALEMSPIDNYNVKSRFRNRCWRLNKQYAKQFQFSTRTVGEDIVMFGRRR
tara:strand:+ start:3024 stop:3353 length:330 start_codon:yes stop_codon:yes gene_type:complete